MTHIALQMPMSGWRFRAFEDLGEDHRCRCQACRRQKMRYAHVLEHPDWPEPIRVGCVCAGRLEGDLKRARLREQAFRLDERRRARWPVMRTWRRRGPHLFMRHMDWDVHLIEGENWSGSVRHLIKDYETFLPGGIEDGEDARMMTFDLILEAESSGSLLDAPYRDGRDLRAMQPAFDFGLRAAA